MLQDAVTSFLAFISTNIDDLFILMLFFGSGRFRTWEVYGGQYLGIAFLVAVSLLGSLAGLFIDSRFLGLLGFYPIYLATKQVVELLKKRHDEDTQILTKAGRGVLAIAGVTIANGGDNIGVYIPLLATLSASGKVALALVFLLMVFAWCWLAHRLARHAAVAHALRIYGHIAMPVVLFLLGVFILMESGTIEMIVDKVQYMP